jgi:hypothetical protein
MCTYEVGRYVYVHTYVRGRYEGIYTYNVGTCTYDASRHV